MDATEPNSMTDLRVKRRACLGCTIAKVKCTSASLGAESCERCERLRKECIYAKPSSDSRRVVKEFSPTKRLEEKVELLSTQVANLTQHIHAISLQRPQGDRDTDEGPYFSSSSSYERTSRSDSVSPGFLSGSKSINEKCFTDLVIRNVRGIEVANHRLEIYRRHFINYFPFVVVPSTVSVETFSHDSPFLFLCTMSVTTFDDPLLQRRLGQEIKKQICDRLVLGHEVSMDLLQGLLVFVAWYQYFCVPGKHQYFLMSQLCLNMCHELGLDLGEKGNSSLGEGPSNGPTRGLGEIRALLGVYCLSSISSTVLRKRTLMHYNSYIEGCCSYISQFGDAPTDQLIAPFVGIQVLQRKISESFCYYDIVSCGIRGERALQSTVHSFQREIDLLKENIDTMNRNAILIHHLRFLEVWVHEVALHSELWETTFGPVHTTSSEAAYTTQLPVQRTNMLWQLVAATVAYHDWCLSIEHTELLHFPFSWWTEQTYVFIVQVRILFLDSSADVARNQCRQPEEESQAESPKADFRKAAHKEIMLPHTIDKYLEQLTPATTQIVDDDGNKDMPSNYLVLLNGIKSAYESRIVVDDTLASRQFGMQQRELFSTQLPISGARNMDMQESVMPAVSTDSIEVGTSDLHSSSASQMDVHSDLADAGFDEFLWDTMMSDFSFYAPQNGQLL